ncbi:hypothetical protein BerOc1_02980 [Pseudodesulfovibrio hydrargyri]|uniref:Uncharacterized protein n=1 Tax=Pseudodesulfovibrio hydrargyri TaxID=2125990 RepID=A0A1J5N5Z0_9BACT|nr:hypothetical protein [Pseudodesulfovibrio hydrargyri]OIQ51035.1 hypothetical protein BerOc1_02980 [Pseudodesulfovibrio hydrargyri]
MDGMLTFSHGEVRLGSKLVPGILKSLSVRGSVVFAEAERDGLSGKTKTPKGWDDSAISLTVELLTDETSCYDKLAALDALFRGHDNGANPRVLDVANAHVTARGIERVVFAGLDSSETDQDDVIQASLKFTEHRPPIIKAEKRVGRTGGIGAPGPALARAIGERSR